MSSEEIDILWLSIPLILFMILFAWGTIKILMSYQLKKNQLIHQNKILQSTFQQELLKTQLEIQEQTFQNISQEIHDNIGQALSFVKLNINTIDVYNPEDTKEKLLESKSLLSKTIQDLRDLSKTLNTDFIREIGLAAAIEQQLFFLQKTGMYVTSFHVSGPTYKNTPQTEIVLYRIVQELLNNIVKHAEAKTITISMNYGDDKLVIDIKDDGKGFLQVSTEEGKNHNGIGLQNMLNRMAMINGSIRIESAPEMGTSAFIELPKQTL